MANLNNLKHDMVATINNHEVIELITKQSTYFEVSGVRKTEKKKSASVTAKKGIFFFLDDWAICSLDMATLCEVCQKFNW